MSKSKAGPGLRERGEAVMEKGATEVKAGLGTFVDGLALAVAARSDIDPDTCTKVLRATLGLAKEVVGADD